jgi:hypothetical protein
MWLSNALKSPQQRAGNPLVMGNYQTKSHTTATKGGSPMCVYAKDLSPYNQLITYSFCLEISVDNLGVYGLFVTWWMDAPPYKNISDIER